MSASVRVGWISVITPVSRNTAAFGNCVSSFDDVPRVGMSVLSPRDIAYEKVMLGLRTTEGIDEKLLDGKDLSRVKSFFRFSDGKAALTREGIAVMNSVLTEII